MPFKLTSFDTENNLVYSLMYAERDVWKIQSDPLSRENPRKMPWINESIIFKFPLPTQISNNGNGLESGLFVCEDVFR